MNLRKIIAAVLLAGFFQAFPANAQLMTTGVGPSSSSATPSWVPSGASVGLDFVDNIYWLSGSGYLPINSLISTARASQGWAPTTIGQYLTFANNIARITGNGLYSEHAVLNSAPVVSGSTQFNVLQTASTATGANGPDGAAGMAVTMTSAFGYVQRSVTVPNDSNTHTVAFAVPKTASFHPFTLNTLLLGGTGVTPVGIEVNAQTGTILAGSGQIFDLGSWWIVAQQITNNSSGNVTLYARFQSDSSGGTGTASELDLYDTQFLLNQSFLTTLIIAATTTRQADQVSSTLASLKLASTGPYTFYTKWGLVQKPASGARHYLLSVDDGTANNRIALFIDSNGFVNSEVITGGVQQVLITGAADRSPGGSASFALGTNDAQLAVNGVSVGTDTSVTLPAGLTTWRHGSDQAGANQLDGLIQKEAAWNTRQSSAALLSSSAYPAYEPLAQVLTHWFAGGVSGKKIVFTGDSTTSNATTLLGSAAQPGPSTNGWLYTYGQQTGQPLAGTTILNYGNNGSSLAVWLADGVTYGYTATVAAAPDLIVFCFLINDVRLGTTSLSQSITLLQQAVNQLRAALPNTDIVLWGPNSFLTTDTGAHAVVPNSAAQAYTTEMYQAHAAVAGSWPNVAVVQKQDGVFTQVSPALSPYMTDQLHPSAIGQKEEGSQIINAIGYRP